MRLLTFVIDGIVYGVEDLGVERVLGFDSARITAIPGSPPGHLGLLSTERGMLNVIAKDPKKGQYIVIIGSGDTRLGVVAEDVLGLEKIVRVHQTTAKMLGQELVYADTAERSTVLLRMPEDFLRMFCK